MLFKAGLTLCTLGALCSTVVAESCTISSGVAGECLATSECSGTSTAGFCPGAANIQCCTYGSCTSGGAAGLCIPTSGCTGTSTAGLCPGPAGIQCCTSGTSSSCDPQPINAATVSLIREFEGFVASPEPDPIGLPTVGYGHLCQSDGCAEVSYSFPLTEENAAALLHSDVKTFEDCVYDYLGASITLNDNQFGAIVSLAFNVGCGNVKSSSLISRLNAGETPNTVAAEEFPKWNKAGGSVLAGLTRRRAAEVVLFKTASDVTAHPAC
ncbi:lysozyme [Eremomyces bilateralis CBS 781.70]|uniref:Lysozyme n=1 Tax=Eremomyces bilateralis CBS 781.70 TaxID=1392243 RepID=A0A6G1FSR6_9PEZI|nr:lysozyme [Eremomyces bilateralis CBS 781.70]KAF1808722.1 lysozyme [Eremomyces bilateralis CBS 781.70]